MKLLYIANIRMPTEKAHGVQIMKMCEAFAALGHEVELVVTDRKTPITEDPFAYYGVQKTFTITRLHAPDTVRFGSWGFLFESWMFARTAARYISRVKPDMVYGRDERVLAEIARVKIPFVWETHTGARNRAARRVLKRAKHVVAISQGLKDFYVAHGAKAERICVAHDGVDLAAFAHTESKDGARKRLGLPLDAKVAMYIGRLDGWKGIDTLLEASKLLSDAFLLAVIGGEPAQVEALSARYPAVRFLGYRPYTELPDNQTAADVLVLPNTGTDTVSVHYTSPLKLFSYMASGVPLVASDLLSIREVVDEKSAILVPPDDAGRLAEGIQNAYGRNDLAQSARSLVEKYTWSARAAAIIECIV
ncbi:MAG: glycosyltransferase family 4 protein [Patescibacteria group bacterium]|nr:glycosyltransferase family 4 protein [Patescibacteria group bacterium]